MSTVSNNNVKKSIAPKSLFDDMQNLLDSTISFNKGDLLFIDTTAHLIKPVATDADSKVLLGVAREDVVLGKLKSPYSGTAVDAAQGTDAVAGPLFGIEVELKLKSGDTFNPGDVVYAAPAVDAQTVSSVDAGANSEVIGVYVGKAVTAGASSVGNVMLGARYPENVLKY